MMKRSIRSRVPANVIPAVVGMLLAIGALASIASVPGCQRSSSNLVCFPDPVLEVVVRNAIRKPNGDIYRSDLLDLTTLNASQLGIVSIEGIQHCVGLTDLFLYDNQIVDITALSELRKLRVLGLSWNRIRCIGALSDLNKLTVLGLSGNQITDIGALSDLDILMQLYVHENEISDISALSGLDKLTKLDLSDNQIRDITPLLANQGIGEGDWVDIQKNLVLLQPGSASALVIECLQRRGVEILFTQAVGVRFPDPGLEAAVRDAIGKPTGDIHDADLAGRTTFDASGRNITDLEGIQCFEDLTELRLRNNSIADISALSGLTNLTLLALTGNRISDMGPLSGLIGLMYLELTDNRIVDISELSRLSSLFWLEIDRNRVVDIAALSGLTDLAVLRLEDNQIVDIGALSGLSSLDGLYLEGNKIHDISPLTENGGIGSGDHIYLERNRLNLQTDSQSMLDIETLIRRGADVHFGPQN